MRRELILTIGSAILFTVAAGSDLLGRSESREIRIGGYDYVITVPIKWKVQAEGHSESMDLHFRIDPIMGRFGHFTVHVMDRNGLSLENWFEYHLNTNLPSHCGSFSIESIGNVSVGPYEGKSVHAIDLEKREGYGIIDVLLFTEAHVVFMSCIYDRLTVDEACRVMVDVVQSFEHSVNAVERSELYYEVGRILGLENAGLFLSLPTGSVLEEQGRKRDEVVVRLSMGELTVLTYRKVSSGIEGMRKLLKRRYPDLLSRGKEAPATIGTSSLPAFQIEAGALDGEPAQRCVFGLNGKGGFALVLSAETAEGLAMLKKIGAKAVLMDAADARRMRASASRDLKIALRKKDAAKVEQALSSLVLFTENQAVAREIGAGLRTRNEQIQADCAEALGRMGSPIACKTLDGVLAKGRISPAAQVSCVQALGRIDSASAKSVLIKFQRRLPKACPVTVRNTVNKTLASFKR